MALEIYESHLPDNPYFADGDYRVEIEGCARAGFPYCSGDYTLESLTVTFTIDNCDISYFADGFNLVTAGFNVL